MFRYRRTYMVNTSSRSAFYEVITIEHAALGTPAQTFSILRYGPIGKTGTIKADMQIGMKAEDHHGAPIRTKMGRDYVVKQRNSDSDPVLGNLLAKMISGRLTPEISAESARIMAHKIATAFPASAAEAEPPKLLGIEAVSVTIDELSDYDPMPVELEPVIERGPEFGSW